MPSNDKKATWDATVFNEENCPGMRINHKLCCVRFVWPDLYVALYVAQERETLTAWNYLTCGEKVLPFAFRKHHCGGSESCVSVEIILSKQGSVYVSLFRM